MFNTFTIDDIRSWNPCYDPARHLPEDWRGTALDLLAMEQIPAHDRLWVVLREDVIDASTLRLYAVWCARQVLHLNDDPRVAKACDVAERFALGQAAREELEAARGAANAAAREAASGAAWAAASGAASGAAWAAARGAANAAARDAARDAAWDAAWAATRAAANAAARAAARDAAWAAARAAAWDAQVARLGEMLEEVAKGGEPTQ